MIINNGSASVTIAGEQEQPENSFPDDNDNDNPLVIDKALKHIHLVMAEAKVPRFAATVCAQAIYYAHYVPNWRFDINFFLDKVGMPAGCIPAFVREVSKEVLAHHATSASTLSALSPRVVQTRTLTRTRLHSQQKSPELKQNTSPLSLRQTPELISLCARTVQTSM